MRAYRFIWRFQDLFAGFVLYKYPLVIGFPLSILFLVMLDTKRPRARDNRRELGAFVGDISYSVYLWHFPLQLLLAVVLLGHSVHTEVFYTPAFIAGFYGVLIALSAASHYLFEKPVQNWLRKRVAS